MRKIALIVALISLPAAGLAENAGPVAATNAEKATGFRDLAECQSALEATRRTRDGSNPAAPRPTGSLFNRAQGNMSRCEMVQGEALIVVYPRGYASQL